mmetsp:Transcript_15218/g.32813  ORF Transcript_15218/g.32813 Transcript_15218/m.32813 type:complete len:167 (+) Transcript_15218:230-730(+)
MTVNAPILAISSRSCTARGGSSKPVSSQALASSAQVQTVGAGPIDSGNSGRAGEADDEVRAKEAATAKIVERAFVVLLPTLCLRLRRVVAPHFWVGQPRPSIPCGLCSKGSEREKATAAKAVAAAAAVVATEDEDEDEDGHEPKAAEHVRGSVDVNEEAGEEGEDK